MTGASKKVLVDRYTRYIGIRVEDGPGAVFVEEHGRRKLLPHVGKHSPTGLEWGYSGSGPSDLAHSILAHVLDVPAVSPTLYQAFKFAVVSGLEEKGFVLSIAQVQEWLNKRWSEMSHGDIKDDLDGGLDA